MINKKQKRANKKLDRLIALINNIPARTKVQQQQFKNTPIQIVRG